MKSTGRKGNRRKRSMSAAAPRERKEEIVKEEKENKRKNGTNPRNTRSREETRHKPLPQGMHSKKHKG